LSQSTSGWGGILFNADQGEGISILTNPLNPISPVNIIGAALIAQFFLSIILGIGAFILYLRESAAPSYRKLSSGKFINVSRFAWVVLIFFLLTVGCLVLSDEFAKLYRPLLEELRVPMLPWSIAIPIVFFLNMICVTFLVWLTDGSRESPFGPLYFIFPPLAIFLREPFDRVIDYFVFVAFMFSLTMRYSYNMRPKTSSDDDDNRLAYWVVSILSFVLVTVVGYVTRPR
jgi:magnesium-transporting ATPase (P-type)